MKLKKSFGKRYGYGNNVHVAFVVETMYRKRAGAVMEIFIEATVDEGIRNVSLRENGTNNVLSINQIDEFSLYELILKQLE
jgi:hypothetical protein|tara:strand:+ start:522 stop:764 length:243 start_codon:yes stop_codon:yes gene_type:complete